MIKFHDLVPSVYSSASRDFQYLGWLINIVLNSVKHNVDDLYDLPNSKSNSRLTELLAMTLGFKIKRNYDQQQLQALVAILPRILKYKGTITAVKMAGNALIAASGAIGDFNCEVRDGELLVVLPVNLIDVSLFTDLLPYILPAGMTCHIVRKNQIQETYKTKLAYDEILRAEWIPEISWNAETGTVDGMSNIYSNFVGKFEIPDITIKDSFVTINGQQTDIKLSAITGVKVEDGRIWVAGIENIWKDTGIAAVPTIANYYMSASNELLTNVGLLDNSIIPVLDSPISVSGPVSNSSGTTLTIENYTTEPNDTGTTVIIEDF